MTETEPQHLRFLSDSVHQVAGAFLMRHPHGCMERMRLLGLAYFAERAYLSTSGAQIVGGPIVGGNQGPILVGLCDLIYGATTSPEWSRCFVSEGYQVRLVGDPGDGLLCRAKTDLFDRLTEEYQNVCSYGVCTGARYLIENDVTGGPVTLRSILAATGAESHFDSIVGHDRNAAVFEALFSGGSA